MLRSLMGLDLTLDTVATLQTQLEGWIAGLQLVALTLQRRLTSADKLVVSGRHRLIADYLTEDVLAHLPEAIRQFLIQTSILDRLCGPLCDAVTGREGGQEMLEVLERDNLFLVPLDDSREWFRYHRLFADFLHAELNRHFERCQVELWLRQGRLRAAVDWADAMARGGAIDGRPESEVAQLAIARVLIVKGDVPALEHALALLEHLLQTAEAEGRMGISIEALALQALAHWRRGERADATEAAARARELKLFD
jgi:LuxR family maltose regulon positive regulatory protein